MDENTGFRLHERLEADSLPIGFLSVSHLRLTNNRLWPWLILVPEFVGVSEFHQLPEAAQPRLMDEMTRVSRAVAALFPVNKVNIGALGNIVPQLHVHVIGRRCDDLAWPGPVWGSGFTEPYSADEAGTIVGRLRDHLRIGVA